jgi:hypothetical protein
VAASRHQAAPSHGLTGRVRVKTQAKGSPLDYFAGVNMTDLGGLALARKRCCAGTPKSAALSYIETGAAPLKVSIGLG